MIAKRDIFNVVKFGRLIDASGDAEAQRSTGPPLAQPPMKPSRHWPSAKRCVLPAWRRESLRMNSRPWLV